MARVLKKTLQARARRAGVKGYSKMTVAQLQKALASAAKRKPKRKAAPKRAAVKRSSTRRKPMAANGSNWMQRKDDFDQYVWVDRLIKDLKEQIDSGEITQDYEIEEYVNYEADREVTYYSHSARIVIACQFWDWEDSEFNPMTNISQVAYAALMQEVIEENVIGQAQEYFYSKE